MRDLFMKSSFSICNFFKRQCSVDPVVAPCILIPNVKMGRLPNPGLHTTNNNKQVLSKLIFRMYT